MHHFSTNVYSSTDRNGKFKKYDAIIKTFPNSRLIREMNYGESDLAIIYSWTSEKLNSIGEKPAKTNIKLFKKQIIDNQLKVSKHVMAIDNSLFVYRDQAYRYNYLRYSMDGVYANTGYYFDRDVDKTRWEKISKDLSIDVKPWRNTGDHVLLCLQRSNGFSFNYERGMLDWLTKTISDITKVTDRKIIIRKHPGDGRLHTVVQSVISNFNTKHAKTVESNRNIKNIQNIEIVSPKNKIVATSNTRIEDDLKNAWCCIVYNSSPSVVSTIEGVPVFILDPNPKKSQAYPMSNIDLNLIENPIMPDNRQEWLEKLAMSHFSYEDVEKGLLYKAAYKFFEEKNGRI
jgi:hypothetical protein